MEKTFAQSYKDRIDHFGFWEEENKSTIINLIESAYKIEIIKEWGISDLVINSEKVLVKWEKRFRELDDEQLQKRFGKTKDSK